MKLKQIALLLLLLNIFISHAQQQEKKLPLAAKFLKQKLDYLDLTEAQWDTFYSLSDKLKKDLITIRKDAEISKDLIKKRDKTYGDMMKDPNVKKEDYLAEMGRRLQLSKKQFKGFEDTILLKQNFKKNALAILTDAQTLKLSKLKKPKKKTSNKAVH